MKFAALALAFLLVAGCQADIQQDQPPSRYEQIRATGVTYLVEAKETAQRVIAHIDDPALKERLTKLLENVEAYLTYTSESLSTFREGLGPQIVDFIVQTREDTQKELVELRTELEPKWAELGQVVKKHLEEYRTLLEPSLKEYSEKNHQVVEEFKAKFEPVIKELQEKIKVNVEETKSKLTPIVEIIRNHLVKEIEHLKTTYGPHAQEYREQIEHVLTDLRNKYESGELQQKLKTLAEELRPQLKGVYDTIAKAFTS